MKKYIVNILVFFFIIGAVDFLFGKVIDRLYFNLQGGIEKEMNEICINNEYDVLVMGSSRAHHHYVPEIITDSLDLSCFNTGKDGNGIILMYGIYQMVTERYKPSLIIYDISQGFDIYENSQDQGNTRYLKKLSPYVNKSCIQDIFKSYSWQEWAKTFSSLYRYNTSSIETIRDFLTSPSFNVDGYDKLSGTMDYDPEIKENFLNAKVDAFKMDYFKRFILATKKDNVSLVCVISPSYGVTSSSVYTPVKELCDELGIPVLDYYAYNAISYEKDYFKDATHLNDLGARAFTRTLCQDIQNTINGIN